MITKVGVSISWWSNLLSTFGYNILYKQRESYGNLLLLFYTHALIHLWPKDISRLVTMFAHTPTFVLHPCLNTPVSAFQQIVSWYIATISKCETWWVIPAIKSLVMLCDLQAVSLCKTWSINYMRWQLIQVSEDLAMGYIWWWYRTHSTLHPLRL